MNLRDYSDKLHNWKDKLHQTTTNVPKNAFHLSINPNFLLNPQGITIFSVVPLSYHCRIKFETNTYIIRI